MVTQFLWKETMEKIYNGHKGEECCFWRAQTSVCWPDVTQHITHMVKQCTCVKLAKQKKESLMPTGLQDNPWQVVKTDLFEIKGINYLIAVDYFSLLSELLKLKSTTSSNSITAFKQYFQNTDYQKLSEVINGHNFFSCGFSRLADT